MAAACRFCIMTMMVLGNDDNDTYMVTAYEEVNTDKSYCISISTWFNKIWSYMTFLFLKIKETLEGMYADAIKSNTNVILQEELGTRIVVLVYNKTSCTFIIQKYDLLKSI